MVSLEKLNALSPEDASTRLRECCASTRWVERMVRARPFGSMEALMQAADAAWEGTRRADWLEAFAGHPRIGERAPTEWSREEQATAARAGAHVAAQIAELNREYEERSGHVYVVCATGRTGEEILSDLLARLGNDPEHELRLSAREQHRITRLRLGKLIGGEET
jgi:2-oxo-4-hydroxy-4-carboxy-5-ureidoimidazoline decarboxylase